MQRKSAFSRRLPDLVTEELVSVLSKKGASFEFKQLFDAVDANGSGTIDAKELKGLITAML